MDNTVQLPQDLYEAIRKKALATADLVIEWVSEHLQASETSAIT